MEMAKVTTFTYDLSWKYARCKKTHLDHPSTSKHVCLECKRKAADRARLSAAGGKGASGGRALVGEKRGTEMVLSGGRWVLGKREAVVGLGDR